jgi:hypothetical protein
MVSCLTFHEVKDEPNKLNLFNEQMRVLKQGGQFIFMDLFLETKTFGDYNTFINSLNKIGLSKLERIKLSELIKMPKLLLTKKILGNAVLIRGVK